MNEKRLSREVKNLEHEKDILKRISEENEDERYAKDEKIVRRFFEKFKDLGEISKKLNKTIYVYPHLLSRKFRKRCGQTATITFEFRGDIRLSYNGVTLYSSILDIMPPKDAYRRNMIDRMVDPILVINEIEPKIRKDFMKKAQKEIKAQKKELDNSYYFLSKKNE